MLVNYFEESEASRLEKERARKRSTGRLPYDCYNALYPTEGTRVYCKLGCQMNTALDGTIDLVSVLAGRKGSGCSKCKKYDDGGENERD